MKQSLALLTLPALVLAYPGAEPDEKRQSLGGVVGGLVDEVTGLLGSIAEAVNPDNLRPEPGFEYQEPGPGDSRGPCPGLNLLANYGYLPRDGHVNMGQVLEATSRGFNLAADLATVLSVFAILTDGDIATESWYLGTGPDGVGGLNRHDTVEADASPNREDYWLGCGDVHSLSSRIFSQNVAFAAQSPSKDFGYDTMSKQWAANSKFSQLYNPWIYMFPFPSIVAVVAYNFYPELFSNGTYGAGGVANYESISSIIGAQFDKDDGTFEYVPEKWPENWYRRATPYEAVQALTDGFTRIYPSNPVPMPIAQLGTPNFNATTVLCDVYSGINSISPLALGGDVTAAAGAITWALGKLDPFFSSTVLGCPQNELNNNFLYPNGTTEGGPFGPAPIVVKGNGNNVYYKTYFTEAPTKPTC